MAALKAVAGWKIINNERRSHDNPEPRRWTLTTIFRLLSIQQLL
jgi:hypothetical protein